MIFAPREHHPELKITHLNQQQNQFKTQLEKATGVEKEKPSLVQRIKSRGQKKDEKKSGQRIFVLDFNGDIQASAVHHLREEISALLPFVSAATDKILLRLESPGGLVQNYGLAASQLTRIRDAGIPLEITVDKVAASGGYMMAAVADRIYAAPFAVVGSIGVVAQLPNFRKILDKNQIDFNIYTAGKYKRTVTMFGENTPEGEEKFREELEETHQQFKSFISHYRPALSVDEVATGEHWLATDGLKLGLVDELVTSDSVIARAIRDNVQVYHVQLAEKPSLMKKLKLLPGTRQDLVEALVRGAVSALATSPSGGLAEAMFYHPSSAPVVIRPSVYAVDPLYACFFNH